MTRIDQFESVFLAAAKEVYRHEDLDIRKALIVTDLADASEYRQRIQSFLSPLGEVDWQAEAAGSTVQEVLAAVDEGAPDLVVTYRNLQKGPWQHSLGSQVDVLTQATDVPVLLTPRPEDDWAGAPCSSVFALTDHLTGDARLVHYAVAFTSGDGELTLAHVEDERVFSRYMEVISKIPEIDTDIAREELERQLFKEPKDYIRSVRETLAEVGSQVRVNKVVTKGHHVAAVRGLVRDSGAHLMVLNTKDDDQDAMHGLAYPLAIEIRDLPMLLL